MSWLSFAAVKFPSLASSITFFSKGPTAGLLSVADVSDKNPPAVTKVAAAEEEADQNGENDEVTADGQLPDNTAAWNNGNEDKNASLDLLMKTSNPTLILPTGHFLSLGLLDLNI